MAKAKKLKQADLEDRDVATVQILKDVIVFYSSNKTIGRKLLVGTKDVTFVADTKDGDFIVKYKNSLYLARSSERPCFKLPRSEDDL